ncbi:MAG: molybdopterin-dependent oxidoreductase [Deltaproteobacteria bacterium]|nr:molybdopterin-dependent oxidoreductase [Deltaproteobacteria bacterium]
MHFPIGKARPPAIIWGVNPHESERVVLPEISAIKARAGKLIVIDPRLIPLAKEADIYTAIRPGTDAALALGLLNVIIEEQLYDKDFVEKWTVGFEQLAQHVKQYALDRVAEITWIPANRIRAISRTYTQSKPANIYQGVAADHSINGFQAHRAIVMLMTITGNLDGPGGNVWTTKGPPFANLRLPDRVSLGEGIGSEFPIFNRFSLERQALCVPDAILSHTPYPIMAMIAHGTEPMREWPNTKKVEAALRKLELLVVIDLFLTDTAKLAHVVLPAASFLEKQWKETEELAQYLLGPTDITFEQLKENPNGVFYSKWEPKRHLREGFNTPSGRPELYSELLRQYGYDPLLVFVEPAESPISRPDLAQTYPLILVTGPKTRFYTHSRFRDLTYLRGFAPWATVEINSETARGLGVGQCDMVSVESPRGKIRVRAAVTEDIHPKVVSIQNGWGGKSQC